MEKKPTISLAGVKTAAHDNMRDFNNGEIEDHSIDWREDFLANLRSIDSNIEMTSLKHAKAGLASILEGAYYAYRADGKGAFDLGSDLRLLLEDQVIPASLNESSSIDNIPGKRQPGFEESITATLERFDFIENLENTFGEKIGGIIVGGSMSYGPFFNVRGQSDNSDIDAIMVMNDSFFDHSEWEGLLQSSVITDEDKRLFLKRKAIFEEMYLQGEAQVFSQRFHANGSEFNMSAHIMPRDVFKAIYSTQLANDLLINQNTLSLLRDYKPKKFERLKCDHQGFSGQSIDYVLPEQESVESGFIATIPAYLIDDAQYYPGLYQCLLLPSALVAYDKSGDTTKGAAEFSQVISNRLVAEQLLNPEASLLNAYPRKAILAPGRYVN